MEWLCLLCWSIAQFPQNLNTLMHKRKELARFLGGLSQAKNCSLNDEDMIAKFLHILLNHL